MTPTLKLNNDVEIPALGLGVFQTPPDRPGRIAENIDVFDFELTADQIASIDGLNTDRRGGPEPDSITLEAFGRDIPDA
jgi:diketogulonate reductase-like aldo/keto reductase